MQRQDAVRALEIYRKTIAQVTYFLHVAIHVYPSVFINYHYHRFVGMHVECGTSICSL